MTGRRGLLLGAVVLAALTSTGGCVGGGTADVTGSIAVNHCTDDAEPFLDRNYSLDVDFLVADYFTPDTLLDDGLTIRLQHGTDYTLQANNALLFIFDEDQTRIVADAVAVGGRRGATFEVGPGGIVVSQFRLYATCPELFGNFQGVGTITFTSFPPPPDNVTDFFRVNIGDRLAGSFELTTIVDLRTGVPIGNLSGSFDFNVERRAGTTPFP